VPEGIDWGEVVALAEDWEFNALLGSRLRTFSSNVMPVADMELIERREMQSRAFSIVLALEQAALISAMEDSGVQSMALKGPVLSVIAYEDVSVRPSADIDLLVRERDLVHARDVLLHEGFAPFYPTGSELALSRRGHALEFAKGKIKVELHSQLLSRHLALTIDSDTNLWSSSRMVECGGRAIRTLGPEHTMLFHCAHGTKHRWSRMKWLLEVAQLWDRLSEDARIDLFERAEACHATRVLKLGLGLALTAFSEETPSGEVPGTAQPKPHAQLLERLGVTGERLGTTSVDSIGDSDIETILFWIRSRERTRDQLETMLRIAFRPTGIQPQSLTAAFVRPVRLLAKGSRHLFQRLAAKAD